MTTNGAMVQASTGNVFADMGMAVRRLASRRRSSRALRKVLKERGLDRAAAAELLGISQPDVFDLTRGKLARFSMDRLGHFLNAPDVEIRIQVGPRPSWKARAGITVEVVAAF